MIASFVFSDGELSRKVFTFSVNIKIVLPLSRTNNKVDITNKTNMLTENRVSANEIQSFRPVHPGELLKDELEYRRLSQKAVAKQVGLSYTTFNEILNGKRPVTTDFAMCMEAALGVPAYMLVELQTDYNLQVARADSKLKKRLDEIRKIAATS
jgi:addiction module HigA family antidote